MVALRAAIPYGLDPWPQISPMLLTTSKSIDAARAVAAALSVLLSGGSMFEAIAAADEICPPVD